MAATAQRPSGTLPPQPTYLSVEYMVCDSATVREGAALVMGAEDNSCALPAAANAPGFVGFSLFAAANGAGQTIAVITGGSYPAIGSGTITRGDSLVIADALGGVKSVTSTIADQASIVGMARESATNTQRVNVRLAPVASLSRPSTLVQTFVAGTGGVTAGSAVVQDTTANNKVVLPAGADPKSGVVGIALNTALAGATAYVVVYGPTTAVAAGAVTRGDNLSIAAATGTCKTAAPAAGVNVMLVGYAQASIADTVAGNVFVRPQMMQGE